MILKIFKKKIWFSIFLHRNWGL